MEVMALADWVLVLRTDCPFSCAAATTSLVLLDAEIAWVTSTAAPRAIWLTRLAVHDRIETGHHIARGSLWHQN